MREIFRYLKPHVPRMLDTRSRVVHWWSCSIPMILSYIIDDVVPTGNITLVYWWGGAMLLCAVMALINNIVANRMASAVARETTRSVATIYSPRSPIFPVDRSMIFPFLLWNPG